LSWPVGIPNPLAFNASLIAFGLPGTIPDGIIVKKKPPLMADEIPNE
jgi:hypothetical protein